MKLSLTILLLAASLSLAACSNTAEGVGRDVEKAGQKIQQTF